MALDIVPITFAEANEFVKRNHRHHGKVIGHKFSIAVADVETGKIVGVAIVGRPVSRFLDDGWTLEVNRLCTDGTRNACSMLYAAAWRAARAMAELREKLKYYEDLEEQGRLLVLPCRVGDTVYEILEETVPNHYFYISEHKVQDVSVKAVKYADEWEPYDYENLYFAREKAEAAMKKRRKDNGF